MTKYITKYTEHCPICNNNAREPGITELASFVCDNHMGQFIVTQCAECKRGIFVFKRNNGERCTDCDKLSKSKKSLAIRW